MRTILNDIKDNHIKQVYLLYGDEIYLKHQYRDKLLSALGAIDDTMNFTKFEGKGIEVKEIISIADTMPFFAEHRTILIVDSGFFKAANDEISDYFKGELPDTAKFIFVEKEVDKRNRLYKAVKDKGSAVEFGEQDEAMLRKWIMNLVQQEGKSISGASINQFLIKTGTDMSNIKTELEKLFCYVGDRVDITNDDIEAIVTTRLTNHIFDMITAIALKNQARALNLYYDLIALKEQPMHILALICRQFNMLLQTKELRTKGYDKAGIAKRMGIPPFVADKYLQQCSKFSSDFLKKALEDSVQTEEDFKSGRISDRLGVELLIVKYSA